MLGARPANGCFSIVMVWMLTNPAETSKSLGIPTPIQLRMYRELSDAMTS